MFICLHKSTNFKTNIVIVPITAVIIINSIFIILVVRNIMQRNRFVANIRQHRYDLNLHHGQVSCINILHYLRVALKRSYAITLLIINLGITWIMFLLYVAEHTQYFAYLFIVFNGSQVIPLESG